MTAIATNLLPATATIVTISIASTIKELPKPTVITWKKQGHRWERYWSGYEDNYRELVHDWGAKDGPQGEVNWARTFNHTVSHN